MGTHTKRMPYTPTTTTHTVSWKNVCKVCKVRSLDYNAARGRMAARRRAKVCNESMQCVQTRVLYPPQQNARHQGISMRLCDAARALHTFILCSDHTRKVCIARSHHVTPLLAPAYLAYFPYFFQTLRRIRRKREGHTHEADAIHAHHHHAHSELEKCMQSMQSALAGL